MTGTATNPLASSEEPVVHAIECGACGTPYDALRAEWCECIVKERTLVCPRCGECFCRADPDYKRNIWMMAPAALWQRKQQSLRERSMPENPSPEEVARPLVLVVDDDRDIRALAVHLMTRRGFGCIHADNGADGLALARVYRPDLILTDALMPRMDGRELCRLVKADPDLATTRVVIMSSVYTAGRFKREALAQFKADEFLAKPVDAASLLPLIQPGTSPIEPDDGAMVQPSDDGWVLPAQVPEAAAPLLSADPANDLPVIIAPVSDPAPVELPSHDGPAQIEVTPCVETALAMDESGELPVMEPRPDRLRITARELIRLRALGLDAESAALANETPGLRVVDLLALRTAGVPFDFIHAIDPDLLATLSASDITTLHGAGCTADAINHLRRAELSPVEIIGILSAGVSIGWLHSVVEAAGRQMTALQLTRLHGAAVDVEYIRALRASRGDAWSVDNWIRLWTLGVTPEFIDGAAEALVGECTFEELIQLWLSGVDLALLQQVREGV